MDSLREQIIEIIYGVVDYETGSRKQAEEVAAEYADPVVISAKLNLDNPMVYDAKGKGFTATDKKVNDLIDQAIAEGKDGLIIKNLRDAAYSADIPSTHTIVFDDKKILTKSQLTSLYNQSKGVGGEGKVTVKDGIGKSTLLKMGFGPEAMGFGESASVKFIDGKPVIAFSFMDESLAGFSVAKDFRQQGVGTKWLEDYMKDEGGKFTVDDPNKDMLKLLNKVGNVSKPDGAGVVTVTASGVGGEGINPLMAEAKKYGSAEEFVKAQTNAYHGTDVSFDQFSRDALGRSTGSKSAEKGFWFTDNQDIAKGYGEYASERKVRELLDQVKIEERKGNWDKSVKLNEQAEELADQILALLPTSKSTDKDYIKKMQDEMFPKGGVR